MKSKLPKFFKLVLIILIILGIMNIFLYHFAGQVGPAIEYITTLVMLLVLVYDSFSKDSDES
jgi:uncharacterized protein YybS (DUF2232 family)